MIQSHHRSHPRAHLSEKWKDPLTIGLLSILFLALAGHQTKWDLLSRIAFLPKTSSPQTPEDLVYEMLDAARAGDSSAYLDCFSGNMRDQITHVIKETSPSKFSKYLADQNRAFTGVALSVRETPDPDDTCVRIEYVYRNRNELQDLYLRREGRVWKIVKVAGSEQIKTLVPYGTAVTD